ncbi:nicotinate-nucleotide adenylyltransferase (Deamido-NAD(+) pyrophosphorylase) [Liquorilactobacillus satsumensis DSM 16230 = JCM 12392]|uniref:Probable nicotinate-nucleotide adenylyltransferase n=2 Tax=Liquorilactobacillus satsumensis TaxID=259059 RepID=A0A0R1V3V5_9LACO|nr:nicotinate-nucleotide adenylyltransferase (Deamido-NAD(+) pyrophosphorylase) [Liquorilactobacillus satsumensis DSM 16230 = JCM 12392]
MAVKTLKETDVQVMPELKSSHEKKRVGILGGTFNPPHLGHLMIAEQVADQLGLNKVFFMPDANPPHVDHKDAIAADQRKAMVELSIAHNPLFELETCELDRGGISYTYDTIKELRLRHPDWEYYFIIGGDMVAYLPKWHRISELVKLVHFVGVGRSGYSRKSRFPILWVDVPLIEISSTNIRWRVRNHCSIKYLVTDNVMDYIREEGLYRE